MGGFFSGIMESVSPRIEEAHQRDLKEKLDKANYYKVAAENASKLAGSPPGTLHPTTGKPLTDQDRAQFNNAAGEFYNQYSSLVKGPKPLKPLLDKLGQVAGHVFGGGRASSMPAAQPAGGGSPALSPLSPAPAPAASQSSATAAQPATNQPLSPPPAAGSPASSGAAPAALPPPPAMGTSFNDAMRVANPAPPTAEMAATTAAKAQAAGHIATVNALTEAEAKIDQDTSLSDDQKETKKHQLAMSMGLIPKTQLKESTAVVKGSDIPEAERTKFGIDESKYYRRTWHPLTGETVSYNAAVAPMGQIRAVTGASITPETAKQQAAAGKKFLDESGQEIDVASLKPFEKLTPVETNRGVHWLRGNQNSRYTVVGNIVYEFPAMGQIGVPGTSALGPKQVPVASNREAVGVDANGNPVKQNFASSRAPAAPGVTGGLVPPPSTATPPAAPPAPRRAAPGRTAAPASSGPTAAKPSGGAPAFSTPGFYNTQATRATPVRTAAIQLIGSPDTPTFTPLESYAPLADDPMARKRVGDAWRVIADELAKSEGGTSGGFFISPETWKTIHNFAGLTNLLASSQTKVVEDAMSKLKPEERDMLDREIAAFGSIIGLRSLTKASAAQFSAKSIERELPILGINTSSSRQFYNKLASLFEEIVSGSKNIGDSFLPEKAQYRAAAERLAGLAGGKPGQLNPPPGGAPKTAEEFLSKHK